MTDTIVAVPDAAVAPTVDDARAVAAAISQDADVARVLLFGSVARGNASAGSDIDMMVIISDTSDYIAAEDRAVRAAWATTDQPVDLNVERVSWFEHHADKVTASFEHALAQDADTLILYAAPDLGGSVNGDSIAGVPRDNIDHAALCLESAAADLSTIST